MKSIKRCFKNSINSVDQEFNISDIDSDLYDYGIVYNNKIYDLSQILPKTKYQKFKSYAKSIYLSLNIIKYFWHIYYKYKYGFIPIYHFDIVEKLGGITIYFYLSINFCLILCLRIIYLFNFKVKKEFSWLNVIEILKGSKHEINGNLI